MNKWREEVFEEFNARLRKAGLHLEVICVGGFVLSYYGMRATQDVDGFYKTNDTIEQIIREVGEHFGINNEEESWLNNSVQNLNAGPPESVCEVLYEYSNLKVMIPPLDYVAGMKLVSAREQDLKDVAAIIKRQQIEDPEILRSKLKEYGLAGIDEGLLLEAFGEAYGMQWLEDYYVAHEEEILGRLS